VKHFKAKVHYISFSTASPEQVCDKLARAKVRCVCLCRVVSQMPLQRFVANKLRWNVCNGFRALLNVITLVKWVTHRHNWMHFVDLYSLRVEMSVSKLSGLHVQLFYTMGHCILDHKSHMFRGVFLHTLYQHVSFQSTGKLNFHDVRSHALTHYCMTYFTIYRQSRCPIFRTLCSNGLISLSK